MARQARIRANIDDFAAFANEPAEESAPASASDLSLEKAVRDHIDRVLQIADGCVSEAARLLRIPRRTLQRKLVKLRIR